MGLKCAKIDLAFDFYDVSRNSGQMHGFFATYTFFGGIKIDAAKNFLVSEIVKNVRFLKFVPMMSFVWQIFFLRIPTKT
jgi:hypothetical protein